MAASLVVLAACDHISGPAFNLSGNWDYTANLPNSIQGQSCNISTVLALQHVGTVVTGQTVGGTATCQTAVFPLRTFTVVKGEWTGGSLSFDLGDNHYTHFGHDVRNNSINGSATVNSVDLGNGQLYVVSGTFRLIRK